MTASWPTIQALAINLNDVITYIERPQKKLILLMTFVIKVFHYHTTADHYTLPEWITVKPQVTYSKACMFKPQANCKKGNQ